VSAGARTRLASILHGAWLLLFVLVLPGLLARVPTASLAAILVVAVVNLINVSVLRQWWQKDRINLIVYATTATAIVVWGVLPGVAVGIGLSLAKLLYTFSHLNIRLEQRAGVVDLYLEGAATFIRLPKLAAAIETVPPGSELHVHIDGLTFIDDACFELLNGWQKQHVAQGGKLFLDWDSLPTRVNAAPPILPRPHSPAARPGPHKASRVC
jgi:MFS superfamily sulfate permease-like transporter